MDLPVELLEEIAHHITPADAKNVALTCRGLYPFFSSYFYRHILFSRIRASHSPGSICRRILLLLRALLQNPSRRRLIRTFWIYIYVRAEDIGDIPEYLRDLEGEYPLSQSDVNQLKAHILTEQFPQTQNWLEALENGHVGIITALLVSLMPNLEILILDPELPMKHNFLALLIRHTILRLNSQPSSSTPIPLKNLKVVYYTPYPDLSSCISPFDDSSFVPPQVPLLFYLPSIESISALIPYSSEFTWSKIFSSHTPPLNPPISSNLAELSLKNSFVDSSSLAALLSATPNLQILRYQLHIPWECYELDLESLAPALCKAPSLEELHLSVPLYEWDDQYAIIVSEFSSLAPLTKLRNLTLPLEFLLESEPEFEESPTLDTLPWGLESLTVLNSREELDPVWAFHEVMDRVGPFLEARGNGKSALKEVYFELHKADLSEETDSSEEPAEFRNGWYMEDFEEWEEVGKKNGVVCEGIADGCIVTLDDLLPDGWYDMVIV